MLVSFLISTPNKVEEEEVGRYQLSTTTAISKKGSVYVVETIIDTKTGTIVRRKKIFLSKYKLPYKDNYGRMINND
jgi:hypothetical protein